MAGPDLRITLKSNRIPAVLAALRRGCLAAVEGTAAAVAQEAARTGHVVTGAMDQSVYVSGPRTSNYALRVAAATALRPEVDVLNEMTPRKGNADRPEAVVAVAEPYAAEEEDRAGHSFFYPSAASVAPTHAPRTAQAMHREVAAVAPKG